MPCACIASWTSSRKNSVGRELTIASFDMATSPRRLGASIAPSAQPLCRTETMPQARWVPRGGSFLRALWCRARARNGRRRSFGSLPLQDVEHGAGIALHQEEDVLAVGG